jgi:excisionase family DNA binding protein
MGTASRQNTPDPGGRSRYGPTPAEPGGGGRSSPTTAGGEGCRWHRGDPDGRSQAQLPPTPSQRQDYDRQPDAGGALSRLPEVLKIGEVAAILRVGRNQLYEAVARGELRAVRIGRTIRIPKAALLDLLAGPPHGRAVTAPPARPPMKERE